MRLPALGRQRSAVGCQQSAPCDWRPAGKRRNKPNGPFLGATHKLLLVGVPGNPADKKTHALSLSKGLP